MVALEYTVSFLQNEQKMKESEYLLDDRLAGIDNTLNELLQSPLA